MTRFGPLLRADGVTFRLWAPAAQTVELVAGDCFPMQRTGAWFEKTMPGASAGTHYQFKVDDELTIPDPASRFQPADVVVLDVLMPDLDGDKLARLLRKSGRHANLAIILISGRPAAELEPLAMAAGADAVVSKSDVRSKLASTVRAAHRGRSVSQHLSR